MTTVDPAMVIAAARAWLGTPYHNQASARGAGCDCLGLIRGVWRDVVGPEPFAMPAYTPDWGETSRTETIAEGARRVLTEIAPREAGAGALLVFRMRRRAVAKHMGIMTDVGTFIHSRERLGVIEESMTKAWRRRVAYAFLFPGEAV